MILFLTYKCIVSIGKVETFVGIYSVMRHRSVSEKEVFNESHPHLKQRKCTYSSVRFWSQRECQFVCWKALNLIHWYWDSDKQASDEAYSSSTETFNWSFGLSWPVEQCSKNGTILNSLLRWFHWQTWFTFN